MNEVFLISLVVIFGWGIITGMFVASLDYKIPINEERLRVLCKFIILASSVSAPFFYVGAEGGIAHAMFILLSYFIVEETPEITEELV